MSEEEAVKYPQEVQAVIDEMKRIRGVADVSCDICSLEGVRAEDLGSFAYARFPITTLRRTNGGRPDEGLLSITFTVSRDEDGWRAVEFLAWIVRDRARGGCEDDIRPFGLPAVAGADVQLGQSLRFIIEMFLVDPADGSPLRRMKDFADDLRQTIDLYDRMLRDRFDTGVTYPLDG